MSQSHYDADQLLAFLPMAMESRPLSDALISWASGHIATFDSSYEVTALEARSKALTTLAKDISSHSDDFTYHETNTAACLVLLTAEVSLGYHTQWYRHMQGAGQMIMSASCEGPGKQTIHGPATLKGSSEGQWLLRNFAYHDILGSVTLGTRPLIRGNYLEGITVVEDTYLGVGSEILTFISEISFVDVPCYTDVHIGIPYEDQTAADGPWETFLSIKRRLQRWRCRPGATSALAAAAYSYRSAALIYLYRQMRKHKQAFDPFYPSLQVWHEPENLQDQITQEVANTLLHVSNVPLNGLPECSLLFPLFLAGGEAIEGDDIDTIRTRLKRTHEFRRFGNIVRALEVLEEVWRRRGDGLGGYDWEHLLASQGVDLLLT